ncbi:MAG: hypothetical protein Fur0024_2680 [Patescibacteria group bacterium]
MKNFLKKFKDAKKILSPTYGELFELTGKEFPHISVALAKNIKPTLAHFHKTFDEVYFVKSGWVVVKILDPKNAKNEILEFKISKNDSLVIPKNVRHKIVSVSQKNELLVINTPSFKIGDEILSDKIL